MGKTILTERNCHRAAVVRQIAHPEYGDWRWTWRGQPLNNGFFGCNRWAHTAGEGSNSVVVGDNELHLWEVVAWRYEVNFEDLWDAACRAFSNTSFSPEERGAYYIRMYEEQLNADLADMPAEERERYVERYRAWAVELFGKHSRIASSMITGPANFPTRRNEKANSSYDKASSEFIAWREKALAGITKRIEASKPAEQKEAEAWEVVKRDIDTHYLPANLYNRMETVAKRGDVALIDRAMAYVRDLNTQRSKPIFTERHKFFKLGDVARNAAQIREQKANASAAEITFESGKVVKNYQENRLQIVFDERPNAETITNLKKHGFKWSPRFGAWQRQLTANAYYGAASVIPVTIEQLK